MTHTPIASLFAGVPLALSRSHGAALLQMPLPQGGGDPAPHVLSVGAMSLSLEPGERYAIHRNIAVVPLCGLLTPNAYLLERWLGWTTYHGLEATMAELAANEDVAAIALLCDSPGGYVLGIEAAAQAVAAARAVKPVHALVHPLAASAAYYIASQASDITLTPGSVVGSIGCMQMTSAPVQPGMSGDQAYIFTSSQARAKRPDPATEEGRRESLRVLDAMEADFHAAVAAGRGIDPADLAARLSVSDDPADGGAIFWGQEAVTRGLADHLEDASAFWSRLGAAYAPRPSRAARRSTRAQALAAQALAAL
ncbi:S49 family peptidase [Salipiger marinus]|uniref:Peptidase family S49 n=1 Tax=Salipiger marinus TaxID=555512 RepID=A0A1G8RXH0_9RHOB|nr:S49 family peptidase [Salipiger marinus]SDJ21663.1 Peptidase family S49 [Salipiger marinus]